MSSELPFKAPDPSEVQELLPSYDVHAFIAQGGMGAVYLASQRSLDREVAIKILPRQFGANKAFRSSFEAEAKAMAKLNHPNLIGVYDFGEVDGMPYIAMEYVKGKSLHHSAHGKAIEQKEAGRLALGICKGLAHAHDAGILHRDIKPANILLDPKARPKIGDFGLARAVESTEGEEFIFGTPGYTAPEVMKDPDSVDKRSDVFSTGVILYELLTGELPGTPTIPASRKGEVDPRFDKIVRRATHPSPNLRFADAGAMARELRKLVEALERPSAATIVTSAKAAAPKALATEDDDIDAATDASGAVTPTSIEISTGHSWAFLRNIVIIIVLLGAIYGMTKALEWKKKDNAKTEQAFKEKKQKEERLRLLEIQRKAREQVTRPTRPKPSPGTNPSPGTSPGPDPTPVPDPTPPAPIDTPLDILARLQPDLVAGNREAFPPTTVERGDRRYFFVPTPMAWSQAADFAEQHGGHLVTLTDKSALNWITSQIPRDATIWLGGGSISRSAWGWIDGTDWSLERSPSTSTGPVACLTDLGTVRSQAAGTLFPFFIQWQMDGSNPGTFEAQLERTKATLNASNTSWPPGTLSFESRRYLIISREMTWTEAAKLARLSEGHLAVPSDQGESDFLVDAVQSALPVGAAAWIGGQNNGRSWAWITGEPWTFASWCPDSPNGDATTDTALRIVGGDTPGWDNASPADPAAGRALIIEWSKDLDNQRTAALPTATGELGRLRKIGLSTVTKRYDKFKSDISYNGSYLSGELDSWFRSKNESSKATHRESFNTAKAGISQDGRIPADLKRGNLPSAVLRLITAATDKQQRLELGLYDDVNKLRLAYLKRLNETRTSLQERGLVNQVKAIDNEISACGDDGRTFLLHFVPDF